VRRCRRRPGARRSTAGTASSGSQPPSVSAICAHSCNSAKDRYPGITAAQRSGTDWSIGGTGDTAGLSSSRIWLDVPYADKDEAKTQGAWCDPVARRWYAPRPGMSGLDRWHALPDAPDLLPGEDRDFGSGLFVDLVPSSCWFTNVRSCVSERDWERLRTMITTRAGRRCEICHCGEDRESGRWLEAHECWEFDHQTKVQALRRLICLCTSCHTATHYGLAKLTGKNSCYRPRYLNIRRPIYLCTVRRCSARIAGN